MPPVSRVLEVRGETGLIRMVLAASGSSSSGSLIVVVSDQNKDEVARFSLTPPPSTEALKEIDNRIQAARMTRHGPRSSETWYRASLRVLAEYEAEDGISRFIALTDSKEHRLSPVPPMTPAVMDFREYALHPDLPLRSVVCARAFQDHFLRLETFTDPQGAGVYYSLRLITPRGNEVSFGGLLEQRYALGLSLPNEIQREVARQMQSFWEGNLQGMSVVGPFFRRFIIEKIEEEKMLERDASGERHYVPAEERHEEPLSEHESATKRLSQRSFALPSGATLEIQEADDSLSLVARTARQDSGSTCSWNIQLPQDALAKRGEIIGVFHECIGLLATQDTQKIERAVAMLAMSGARFEFIRSASASMIGEESSCKLHRSGSIRVDMSGIPVSELVASTCAGDNMVRFDLPRLPVRLPIDDIYERLTLVHKADGAIEADSMSARKMRMALRLSSDAVKDAGGAERVSFHLLSAFVDQDKTLGFAFERACKELVDPERDEDAWLLMCEDEFADRPSVLDSLDNSSNAAEFFLEDDF